MADARTQQVEETPAAHPHSQRHLDVLRALHFEPTIVPAGAEVPVGSDAVDATSHRGAGQRLDATATCTPLRIRGARRILVATRAGAVPEKRVHSFHGTVTACRRQKQQERAQEHGEPERGAACPPAEGAATSDQPAHEWLRGWALPRCGALLRERQRARAPCRSQYSLELASPVCEHASSTAW